MLVMGDRREGVMAAVSLVLVFFAFLYFFSDLAGLVINSDSVLFADASVEIIEQQVEVLRVFCLHLLAAKTPSIFHGSG